MKTAVEQFLDAIKNQIPLSNEHLEMIESYASQAKEMEKEQIKSAFTQGDLFAEDYFNPEKSNIDCSENYYNETFKSIE